MGSSTISACKKKRNHKSHVTGRCWDLGHTFIFKQNIAKQWTLYAILAGPISILEWTPRSTATCAAWLLLTGLLFHKNCEKRENASTIPPLFYASVCADVVQSLESLESPIQNTSQRSVSVLNVISCTSPLYPVIWHHAQQVKYSDRAKDTSDSAWRVGDKDGKGSS